MSEIEQIKDQLRDILSDAERNLDDCIDVLKEAESAVVEITKALAQLPDTELANKVLKKYGDY